MTGALLTNTGQSLVSHRSSNEEVVRFVKIEERYPGNIFAFLHEFACQLGRHLQVVQWLDFELMLAKII